MSLESQIIFDQINTFHTINRKKLNSQNKCVQAILDKIDIYMERKYLLNLKTISEESLNSQINCDKVI